MTPSLRHRSQRPSAARAAYSSSPTSTSTPSTSTTSMVKIRWSLLSSRSSDYNAPRTPRLQWWSFTQCLRPLLLVVFLLACADRASGKVNVASVSSVRGRSAIAGRLFLQPRRTRASDGGSGSSICSKSSPFRLRKPAGVVQDDDDGGGGGPKHAEYAFFTNRSARGAAQFLSAQSAFLQRRAAEAVPGQPSTRDCAPGTELEFLESCAPGRQLVSQRREPPNRSRTRTFAAPMATAADAGRGGRGGAAAAAVADSRPLFFWENMVCGALGRSIAQTTMHPANTMKTILQNSRGPHRPTIAQLVQPQNFRRLTVGAGANFLLSLPHGAVNFAILELVRKRLGALVRANPTLSENEHRLSFGLDFLSSSISTVACSVVSTPQMMITDNIMAGNYPTLRTACVGLARTKGVMGFYAGWWPGLVGKIPSYALTWTFFQQLKKARGRWSFRAATDVENSAMGCLASAATVCLMIPMDTIKTRLVSQAGQAASDQAYKGIVDCAVRIFREEGLATFYRGLPPRLVSVVPMIGIQFGVYEFMKRVMLQRRIDHPVNIPRLAAENLPFQKIRGELSGGRC